MTPDQLPPPARANAPVAVLAEELAGHLGIQAYASICGALLFGADRHDHLAVLPYLVGRPVPTESSLLDPTSWKDYWVRTWGARGLLHVWSDSATGAVLAGLRDEHWRPVEMCLKVIARHVPAQAGDAVSAVATHHHPRVRVQVARALAVVGDTEHLSAIEALRDDERPEVRRSAERAVELLADRLDLR